PHQSVYTSTRTKRLDDSASLTPAFQSRQVIVPLLGAAAAGAASRAARGKARRKRLMAILSKPTSRPRVRTRERAFYHAITSNLQAAGGCGGRVVGRGSRAAGCRRGLLRVIGGSHGAPCTQNAPRSGGGRVRGRASCRPCAAGCRRAATGRTTPRTAGRSRTGRGSRPWSGRSGHGG